MRGIAPVVLRYKQGPTALAVVIAQGMSDPIWFQTYHNITGQMTSRIFETEEEAIKVFDAWVAAWEKSVGNKPALSFYDDGRVVYP